MYTPTCVWQSLCAASERSRDRPKQSLGRMPAWPMSSVCGQRLRSYRPSLAQKVYIADLGAILENGMHCSWMSMPRLHRCRYVSMHAMRTRQWCSRVRSKQLGWDYEEWVHYCTNYQFGMLKSLSPFSLRRRLWCCRTACLCWKERDRRQQLARWQWLFSQPASRDRHEFRENLQWDAQLSCQCSRTACGCNHGCRHFAMIGSLSLFLMQIGLGFRWRLLTIYHRMIWIPRGLW